MKKILLTISISLAAAIAAVSSPVRSMLGATETEIIVEDGIPENPTAADYIQDGLIAMWDGIENAGWGVHDDESTVWKDLIGYRDLTINSSYAGWGEDCLVCIGGDKLKQSASCAFCNDMPYNYKQVLAIEICIKLTSTFSGSNSAAQGYKTRQTLINIGVDGTGAGARGRQIVCPKLDDGTAYTIVTLGIGSDWYKKSVYENFGDDYWGKRSTISMNVAEFGGCIDGEPVVSSYYGEQQLATYNTSTIIGNIGGEICSIRVYTRALSSGEVAMNYLIDKIRFNLP